MATLNNDQLDDPLIFDGCPDFSGGQFSNRPAGTLSSTQYLLGLNVDIKTKLAVTRRGTIALPSPNPSRIQALQWFSTPSLSQTLAISGGTAWSFDENSWTSISGYTAAGGATPQIGTAQLINLIYIADATSNLFSWDGTTMVDLGNGMDTQPPQGSIVIAATSRLFCAGNPAVPDEITASQALAAGWANNTLQIRIGAGDGDPIVSLVGWDSSQVVVFKRNSVYIMTADPGVTATDLSQATVTKVTDVLGCVARGSACVVGSDVWFLSDSGVRSIKRVLAQDEREVSQAISEPISDVIQRINPASAAKCAATYWDNKYMLSVPLDNAAEPNAVLIFDTLQQTWSGYWTGWAPLVFSLTKPSGNQRLNFGQPDGSLLRWLDYIPVDNEDVTTFQDAGAAIETRLESCGLKFGDGAVNIGAQGVGFTDSAAPKSLFNVEPTFFQSQTIVNVSLAFDQGIELPLANSVDTTGGTVLILPFILPQVLSGTQVKRRSFPCRQFNPFREVQVVLDSPMGKLAARSIMASAFSETVQPQEL